MGLKDIAEVIREAPEETKIIASYLDAVDHAMVGRKEVRQPIKVTTAPSKLLSPKMITY